MLEMIVYLIFSIVFGAIACFWGRKFYFPIMMLGAFVLSVMFCLGQFGFNWKGAIIGVACGVILALLARFVYKAGLFILGAFGGVMLSMFIINLLPKSMGDIKWVITAICALVLGICAVKWCDVFIMLGTSFQGAAAVASSGCFLLLNIGQLQQFVYADGMFSTLAHLQDYLEHDLMAQNPALLISALFILTALGFLFQLSQAQKED